MEIVPLLIVLVNILVKDCLSGAISARLGFPLVLAHMLSGIIFGPAGFGIIHDHEIISLTAEMGIILMMFFIGMETNVTEIKKVGIHAMLGGMGGVLVSFIFGFTTAHYIFAFDIYVSLFIGVLLTATSVSISGQTLANLGCLRTKEGKTILGAALVDDIFSICLLSIILSLYNAGHDAGKMDVFFTVAKMVLFFIGAIFVGKKVLPQMVKRLHHHVHHHSVTSIALILCFYYALLAGKFMGEVATITGAFIAGICFAKSRFAHQLDKNISMMSNAFFVPIFFVHVGMQVQKVTINSQFVEYAVIIIIVAIVSKIMGSGIGVYYSQFTVLESLRVGFGMVSRGEIALLVCSFGLKMGIITHEIFLLMIIMTVVTTFITPLLLKMSYNNSRLINITEKADQILLKNKQRSEKKIKKIYDQFMDLYKGISG